jgi:hypothetical protein
MVLPWKALLKATKSILLPVGSTTFPTLRAKLVADSFASGPEV